MNFDLQRVLLGVRLLVFDFDGVLADNKEWVFEDGRQAVRCSRTDGSGSVSAWELGIELAILSTAINPAVGGRARKLRIDCNQDMFGKQFELQGMADERRRGISLSRTFCAGNDLNDLTALAVARCPLAVAGSPDEVLRRALWATALAGGEALYGRFAT